MLLLVNSLSVNILLMSHTIYSKLHALNITNEKPVDIHLIYDDELRSVAQL